MPVTYCTVLQVEFPLCMTVIDVNTHLLLDSLGASPSDFFVLNCFLFTQPALAVSSVLQFVTILHYFLGLTTARKSE